MQIEELNLGPRALRMCRRAGVQTAAELARMDAEDMMRYGNFGKKTRWEVVDALRRAGFQLDFPEAAECDRKAEKYARLARRWRRRAKEMRELNRE